MYYLSVCRIADLRSTDCDNPAMRFSEHTERIGLRLPHELRRDAERAAARRGLLLSDFLRACVSEGVRRAERGPQRPYRQPRAARPRPGGPLG